MATPVANLKHLIADFLANGADFSKMNEKLKKPMLVKVFRVQPHFLINDKENYITGYFTAKALKRFEKNIKMDLMDLKARTLKVEKFTMELVSTASSDYSWTTYLGNEIRIIIEEFSLGRYLKRGEDVNKFVVNIWMDHSVMQAIAWFNQKRAAKNGKNQSLEEYLRTVAGFSQASIDELMGPGPFEYTNARLKPREVITAIVDEYYDDEDTPKKLRRSAKVELKEENVKEEQEEEKALLSPPSEDEIKIESIKEPKIRKSNKAYKGKPYTKKKRVIEEYEVPLKSIKMESAFKEEIKEILGKTDFVNNFEMPLPKRKVTDKTRKSKRMANFKEYMDWYDKKCQQSSDFGDSRGASTTNLSTPLKISLRISQRLANKAR